MALAFYDSFDRANGPPGPDWQIESGAPVIESNALKLAASATLRPTTQPTAADHVQRAWVTPPVTAGKTLYFRFHATVDGQNWLQVAFGLTTTTGQVSFQKKIANVTTSLATNILAFTWTGAADCMAAVIGTQLLAWINGFLVLDQNIPDLQANGHATISSGSTYVYLEQYALYELATNSLGITAVDNQTDPPSYTLSLVNGGAPWTPGTPGSPTFAAAAGTITAQTVDDVDHATLTFEPGTLQVPSFIYDYQNDWYYPLDLATTLAGVGGTGGGGGLTVEQADTMSGLQLILGSWNSHTGELTGLLLNLGLLSTYLLALTPGDPDYPVQKLLAAILSETGDLPITATRVHALLDLLNATTDSGNWTLQYAWGQIKGDDNRDLTAIYNQIAALPDPSTALTTVQNILWEIRTVSHSYTLADVITAIADIPAADVSSVLTAISNVRGPGAPDIAAVLTAVGNIPTTSYTTPFSDLQTAVDAIPTNPITSLQSVLDAISGVRGTGAPDLAAVLTAVNARPTNPITSLQSVLDAISTLSGALTDKIALVLSAIEALSALLAPKGPPIWPGLAKATLGTPVSIAQGFTISEACNGVIVNITGVPSKLASFNFDGTESYQHAGALAFVNDDGAKEFAQTFSFGKQVLCPKLVYLASGVVGRATAGLTGTVTPWTM